MTLIPSEQSETWRFLTIHGKSSAALCLPQSQHVSCQLVSTPWPFLFQFASWGRFLPQHLHQLINRLKVISLCTRIGMRVCVKHLNRCKTCTHWTCISVLLGSCQFVTKELYCRGTQHFTGTVSNETTSEMGYPAWPAGRTCNPIFSIPRRWHVHGAKPRTPTWRFCSSFARVPQSGIYSSGLFHPGYGDGSFSSVDVGLIGATQDFGGIFLMMGVVTTTLYLTIIWNSKFTGVFLHAWCIPHHNLIREVWASVWLMSDSTGWHEPFGENLSIGRKWEPRSDSEFTVTVFNPSNSFK